MSHFITLNNEQKDSEKYFKYLFNKVEFDNLKVNSNLYRLNLKKINQNDNNSNFKGTLNTNTQKEKFNINRLKISPIHRNNSQKINLKLNLIKKSPIIKSRTINNKSIIKKMQKYKKLKELNRPSKIQQKYLKILHGALDKELYNEKIEKKIKTLTQRNENYINSKSKENKTEKNKINIINSIHIGKSVINNCILRNKIIYDIKPLNKSEQKGKCFFTNKDDQNQKYIITERNSIKSINSKNSIPITENNIINKEKEKKIINNKNNINININNKSINNSIKKHKSKKIKKIREIHLKSLFSKDISQNLNSPNLKTFYGRGSGDMMRGEKIKFIKTCYPVKFIKPLLTQKGYFFKSNYLSNLPKEINKYNNKKSKNNFNNLVLKDFKRKNNSQIKNVKDELKIIKRNIFNAFKWFDDQKEILFRIETE